MSKLESMINDGNENWFPGVSVTEQIDRVERQADPNLHIPQLSEAQWRTTMPNFHWPHHSLFDLALRASVA